MAELEKECSERTGLRCDMITLYQGGEYDLYQFRKFTDVRLAFAPEAQLAQFGGDNDNFEYPRWSMDFSLFRVYVDGKPYRPQHFLKWSRSGVKEGDVTFLIGNPGSTGRLQTMAQLEMLRDVIYPSRSPGSTTRGRGCTSTGRAASSSSAWRARRSTGSRTRSRRPRASSPACSTRR